jgi:hypothetical protein
MKTKGVWGITPVKPIGMERQKEKIKDDRRREKARKLTVPFQPNIKLSI